MANKYLNDTGLGHFWDKTAYKYGIEYIVGTQVAATNAWTGVTLDKNCVSGVIPTGKVIVYHLPYAGTSSAATLNLTFPDSSTSGAKNVYRLTGSTIGTNFGAGCDLFMVYNGTQWKVSAYQDTDSNNYDRIRHYTAVKAASAVTAGQIIVGTDSGYKPVANGVTFSINYPILYAASAISASATNNNTYDAFPGVNLQTTKSGYTGTTYKMTFLVGTLSGTTFTVNSDIFTQTIPSSVDNKVYAPIGLMTDSNKTVFFFPTNVYWEYRNGAFRPISGCPTLATVATSGSYNDLSNKPTIPTVNNGTLTIQKNGTQVATFTANQSTNATANITVPTKTSDITNDSGYITSSSLNSYLPLSGGSMTGATYGYFPATASTMVGNEYNILLNGGDRFTFTQSGTGTLSTGQVKGLFDGALAPQYSSDGVNPNDPYVLLVEGLPSVHTQTGGVFGWTCRYWVPTTFKVELYDSYNSRGWVTIVEKTNTATKELFVDLYRTSGVGGGMYTKIRITIYDSNGDRGSNGYRRWGISEIFFCHPEAITPYAYANVDKANSATKATQDANGDVINTTYAKVADIPTVNNATLTIQKNGSNVKTFTANASTDVTANITVPTKTSELTNNSNFVADASYVHTDNNYTTTDKNKLAGIASGAEVNVQSDWNVTDTSSDAFIKNKPTIPTVNNATLTIQKNGTTVKTFTANASSNVTANITVPTNTNELTNGAGFITSSDSITGNAATATKATQDSDGNAINTTYLKKSGGAMTGAITRSLASSGTIADTNLFTVSGSTDGFGVNYASTTADTGVTTLYTTDDANAKLSLGNKISSTYKEAISIVNGTATVTGSVSGNAGTATKLAAGKTIAIGTGATGTATSFDGSANITIPITDVKDAYVTWGGKNIVNNVSPDDMGCIDEFGHNKFAFLPAECIEVKYTTDGGTTWVDYGLSDANKVKMLTTVGPTVYAGGSTDNATADNITKLKARVRIACGPTTGGKLYTATKKLLINMSSQGCGGCKVDIRYRTIANYVAGTETWSTLGTYDVGGGSGWNSIPMALTFGGSFSSQTSQTGQIEIVLYCTSLGTWGYKKPSLIDFRLIGTTNWAMPSEMARAGHLYSVDEGQNATFPANVSVTGSLKHGSYTYTLPNKTGTVAMTSDIPTVNNATLTIQKNGSNVNTFTANASSNVTANITVPTKTSDITNDSNFITGANSQKFAIGQGSTQPVFDDMTPVKTIEWDVSDTTYRPIYQIANTGWTYINMDITVAYRVTVTGTNIHSVTDVVDRWFSPASWPLTSMLCKTLSNSAATTGLKYLRAVYPTSSYVNNSTYPLGMEVEMHNTTARHVKVEVFKDNSQVTWNTTKPSGSIYVNSTYNGNRNLEVYATRGWRFHQPSQMYANSANSASYIADFEAANIAAGELKAGATALVAGHYGYLADDGLVYDISDTTHNIAMGESKVGYMAGGTNANTAISWTNWRTISRPSAAQVEYFSHGTLALGNRVFLRCTRDANGNIHSGNYLATSMSAGYTWMPFGWARSATQFYADTRFPMFYTLDSNGKLSHVNGLAVAGTSYTAGSHINISGSTISAKDYVHSESGVSASTVTQTVTNDMIANGTIKFAKVDSTEFVKLTLSTTDISAGSALAKNTLYGVYQS